MFTFVTGGLRSGKSGYALRRASELGPPPWLYIAPNADGDDDLKARLAGYRRDQEARWKLIEAPELIWNGARAGRDRQPRRAGHRSLHDLALQSPGPDRPRAPTASSSPRSRSLADRLYRSTTPAVLVTTEIGLGFLPASVPDRRLDQRRRARQSDPGRARADGRHDASAASRCACADRHAPTPAFTMPLDSRIVPRRPARLQLLDRRRPRHQAGNRRRSGRPGARHPRAARAAGRASGQAGSHARALRSRARHRRGRRADRRRGAAARRRSLAVRQRRAAGAHVRDSVDADSDGAAHARARAAATCSRSATAKRTCCTRRGTRRARSASSSSAPGETPVLFSGDTLFRRSVGRTDLWGGSSEQLLRVDPRPAVRAARRHDRGARPRRADDDRRRAREQPVRRPARARDRRRRLACLTRVHRECRSRACRRRSNARAASAPRWA